MARPSCLASLPRSHSAVETCFQFKLLLYNFYICIHFQASGKRFESLISPLGRNNEELFNQLKSISFKIFLFHHIVLYWYYCTSNEHLSINSRPACVLKKKHNRAFLIVRVIFIVADIVA